MSKTPSSKLRGWFSRLLDLGNDNKLVAAATLVTLATGVPYLVVSTVRAVAGGDAGEETPEIATLVEAALEKALEKYSKDIAAAVVDASATTISVADAADALGSLQQEALRPGATLEEQRRIIDAMLRYSNGEPASALAEFASIATALEERGAPAAAARIWRQRATLQRYSDAPAALADFQHAEELSPGSARDRVILGDLRISSGRPQDAVVDYRAAIELARASGDTWILARALSNIVLNLLVDDSEEASAEERRAAGIEALALLREAVVERPNDVEAVASLIRLHKGMDFPERGPEETREAMRGLVAVVDAIDPGAISPGEYFALVTAVCSHAAIETKDEDAGMPEEETLAWARRALEAGEACIEAAPSNVRWYDTVSLASAGLLDFFTFTEDAEAMRRTVAFGRGAAERIYAQRPRDGAAAFRVVSAYIFEAHADAACGDPEAALQAYEEAMRQLDKADERIGAAVNAVTFRPMFTAHFAGSLAEWGHAGAEPYLEAAQAMLDDAPEGAIPSGAVAEAEWFIARGYSLLEDHAEQPEH